MKKNIVIDKHFIFNRFFEAITVPIIAGIGSVFIIPLLAIPLDFILEGTSVEQREAILGRLLLVACIGLVVYWWYKAFTTEPPNKEMDIIYGSGSPMYHHRKHKEAH